jgi:hypothetical protein
MTSPLNARALLAAGLAALPLLTGCVYHDNDAGPYNAAPDLGRASAGCYWDGWNADYIWYFDAEVSDPDGVYDVVEVWADVYNAQGLYIESFELFRETPDPGYWFSDWLQYYSMLDCIGGSYSVDIVAYDSFGAFDLRTISAYQTP